MRGSNRRASQMQTSVTPVPPSACLPSAPPAAHRQHLDNGGPPSALAAARAPIGAASSCRIHHGHPHAAAGVVAAREAALERCWHFGGVTRGSLLACHHLPSDLRVVVTRSTPETHEQTGEGGGSSDAAVIIITILFAAVIVNIQEGDSNECYKIDVTFLAQLHALASTHSNSYTVSITAKFQW